MNFIFLRSLIGLGAMYPIIKRPAAANVNFIIGTSGKKTAATATVAPIIEEIISLFVDVGVFENIAAKYKDKMSTVKFIKK